MTFEEAYRAHFAFVWRSLRRLGIREEDAADTAQEVFIVVHRKLPEFAGHSKLTTWLYGICFRVASRAPARAPAAAARRAGGGVVRRPSRRSGRDGRAQSGAGAAGARPRPHPRRTARGVLPVRARRNDGRGDRGGAGDSAGDGLLALAPRARRVQRGDRRAGRSARAAGPEPREERMSTDEGSRCVSSRTRAARRASARCCATASTSRRRATPRPGSGWRWSARVGGGGGGGRPRMRRRRPSPL